MDELDNHRRGAGERSSFLSRYRARVTVGKSPQCHRALAGDLEKIGEDVKRQKCLVIQKPAAHEIPNLRVSLLAAVVTHKVRVTNYPTSNAQSLEKKRGQNGDTGPPIPVGRSAAQVPRRTRDLEKEIFRTEDADEQDRCVIRFSERESRPG